MALDLEAALGDAEELLEARSGPTPPSLDDEAKCRSHLQPCVRHGASTLARHRTEAKTLDKRIKEIAPEVAKLNKERSSTLKNMAAGHLSRVEAPQEAVSEVRFQGGSESALMSVITLGAAPESFTELYEEVRNGRAEWTDWSCTPEAALLPEKDLLGMCPGGKPHQSEEQLNKKKEFRCHCSICLIDRKLKELTPELNRCRSRLETLREQIDELAPVIRKARRVLKRLRHGEGEREEVSDPVFYGEDQPFEAEVGDEYAIEAHEKAKQEWGRLQRTLSTEDFPMRVAFLDKSGSMGGDEITYEALKLGLHNCLHPSTGSTLTFLFAGPGETQIVLRRPGDEPIEFDLQLGCATWFNEPILRTLSFLAPLVEALDTQEWVMRTGQPPLQVLCMTDGADNCSPSNLSTLHGLVSELKEIRGPVSGEKLYVPISGPVSKTKSLLEETNKKVPIWMAWIATGMGGQMLLQSNAPKEIVMIDAVAAPRFREPDALPDVDAGPSISVSQDPQEQKEASGGSRRTSLQKETVASRRRKRMSALPSGNLCEALEVADVKDMPSWSIGQRVRVRASEPGRAPKAATVLRIVEQEASNTQYELLFDDESQATVDASQLLGSPADFKALIKATKTRAPASGSQAGSQAGAGMLSRTADSDMQRLQVLGVVQQATNDLAAVMGQQDPKTGRIALEKAVASIHGSEEISEDTAAMLEEKLQEAEATSRVVCLKEDPPRDPTQTLLDAVLKAGSTAGRMLPEDRLVAQRLAAAGLEMLMYGGSLMPDHLVDQLGHFAEVAQEKAARRMRVEAEELDSWYQELGRPLEELLRLLLNLGLMESRQTPEGEVLQAKQEARQCFAVLRRFFEPSATRAGVEDALRRCVNRAQRLRPVFRASVSKPEVHFGHAARTASSSMSTASLASGRSSSKESCGTEFGSPTSQAKPVTPVGHSTGRASFSERLRPPRSPPGLPLGQRSPSLSRHALQLPSMRGSRSSAGDVLAGRALRGDDLLLPGSRPRSGSSSARSSCSASPGSSGSPARLRSSSLATCGSRLLGLSG